MHAHYQLNTNSKSVLLICFHNLGRTHLDLGAKAPPAEVMTSVDDLFKVTLPVHLARSLPSRREREIEDFLINLFPLFQQSGLPNKRKLDPVRDPST